MLYQPCDGKALLYNRLLEHATIPEAATVVMQDVLVSKNGRSHVDFGRFHDTLPINECPTPVKEQGMHLHLNKKTGAQAREDWDPI